MTNRQYAIAGFLAPVFFWVTYFIIAGQRPEFSFLTKAVSELGSVDAPDKWTWNFLGYIIPGILIAVFAWGLFRHMATEKAGKLPLAGIFFSGVFMALAGVFPGDFENKRSATMLLHTIGSFGSYLFFLTGAFTYPRQMSKTAYWKKAIKPTLGFTWLSILFGSWAFVFPDYPAAGQRFVFLFYFLWIIFTAYRLYNQPGVNSKKT